MTKPGTHSDVVVLGAGAAGLLCAIEAARRGRRVAVIDHNERPGEKLRISGGGRCNCTNLSVRPENYASLNPLFCTSALARYRPQQFLALLGEHGLAWHTENIGEVFCDAGANAVADMLVSEARAAGVVFHLNCRIGAVSRADEFRVGTPRGVMAAPSLVIATGGLACPRVGATGIGYAIARHLGLAVAPTRPGLTALLLGDGDAAWKRLSGIALDAVVTCGRHAFHGSLLFTHRGLSGPAALQASLYWSADAPVSVDFLPGQDAAQRINAARAGGMRAGALLQRHLPRRVVDCLLSEEQQSVVAAQCTTPAIAAIAAAVHRHEFIPAGAAGYATAEVTGGGIDTRGLSSKTMEARTVPGLYCIGEVVDVTGQLGGYNLHWAWASGYAAGQAA